MNNEYLVGYSVDVLEQAIRIYSNVGSVKEVLCDSKEEFLRVVETMNKTLKDGGWIGELSE
jgi:hypothetical protein